MHIIINSHDIMASSVAMQMYDAPYPFMTLSQCGIYLTIHSFSHFLLILWYLRSSCSIASAIEVEPLFGPQFVSVHTLCFLLYEDPQLDQSLLDPEQSLWNVRTSSLQC